MTLNEIRLERQLGAAKKALRTIAEGRPDDVTEWAWGEWCTQWAQDELAAIELIKVEVDA